MQHDKTNLWLREAGRRKRTPESRAYRRDQRAQTKHVKQGIRELRKVLKRLEKAYEKIKAKHKGRARKKIRKREREALYLVCEDKQFQKILDEYLGTSPEVENMRGYAESHFRYMLTGRDTRRSHWKALKRYFAKGFEIREMEESQTPVREAIPEPLRKFLPANIVVKVDDDGTIQEVTERFANEFDTLKVKRRRQRQLVSRYNKIVKMVKKDMRSRDALRRIQATVTAIIMETGIRPGRAGNSATIEVDGKRTKVETFGAITLRSDHVQMVEDNFAHLEFTGKAGTTNRARLTDKRVIKVLKSYIKRAQKEFGKKKGSEQSAALFVTPEGEPFGYTQLKDYFDERAALSGLYITDFRKLRSTEAVLSNLQDRYEALLERIKGFVDDEVGDLKGKVVEAIQGTVEEAYERSRQALSHEDMTTTVENYVNPEVLLRFLSTGEVEDKLEDIILNGETALSFSVETFIEQAKGA